jgi:hypothetical protein
MKRKWLGTTAVLVVLSVAMDYIFLGGHERAYFPGFYALFGLAGAAAIIIMAWVPGRYWLGRDENYYKHGGDDE